MADSDLKQDTKFFRLYTAIDAAVAVDDGVWIDAGHAESLTAHLVPGTGTLQLRGSNLPTKPLNSAHGFQIGPDVTAERVLSVPADPDEANFCGSVPRWVKVRVSAHTAGTHNAYLLFRSAGR